MKALIRGGQQRVWVARLVSALLLLGLSSMVAADGISVSIGGSGGPVETGIIVFCPESVFTATVNTVADVVADDGLTSLREAIALAKEHVQCADQWDQIVFDLPAPAVMTLNSALLLEDDAVMLLGTPGLVLRSSNPDAPLLSIIATTASTNVVLFSMALEGQQLPRTQPAIRAGSGTYLTLAQLLMRDFAGGAAAPGAIDADGVEYLEIVDSLFLGNSGQQASHGGGGAVSLFSSNAAGVFRVLRTTFSGNAAWEAGSSGGALLARLPVEGLLQIEASTFDGNQSSLDGGALAQWGGLLAVTNSTFSGNEAAGSGGGIYFAGDGVRLAHSTIVANRAFEGGGVAGPAGVTLPLLMGTHTILSLNTAANGAGGDNVFRLAGSLEHSLLDADAASLKLGALDFYGGYTRTHALLPGSVAIDAGDTTGLVVPEMDQRGLARVQGSQIDMGAVEAVPPGSSAGATGLWVMLILLLVGMRRPARIG